METPRCLIRRRFAEEHGARIYHLLPRLFGLWQGGLPQAAARLQASLDLPYDAVRYLTSHGSLDIGHLAFFEGLVNRLEEQDSLAPSRPGRELADAGRYEEVLRLLSQLEE